MIIPSEHFVPPEAPLAGIFQYDQAQALRSAGVHVGVVAPELRSLRDLVRPKRWFRRGLQGASENGIRVFRWHGWHWALPRFGLGHSPMWLRAGRRLATEYLAREGRPDVVHAHNARYAGMLAVWLNREHGIPFVLTEHSSAYARGLVPKSEMNGVREAFASAAERFVVSPALGAILEREIGAAALPYEVLPNLLDPEFESQAIPPTRQSYPPFKFLNVAELNENKGHADLLEAFAKVAAQRDCVLRIVGDGPLAGTLRATAAKLGLEKNVTFAGRVARGHVRKELEDCDAFVLSSHRETFGVVVTEALSCGKPVIATASGGPDSIVTPENGFLVPPQSPEALAGAMVKMMDKAPHFDPAALRRDCLGRFGAAVIVRRLIDSYDRVSAKRKGVDSSSRPMALPT